MRGHPEGEGAGYAEAGPARGEPERGVLQNIYDIVKIMDLSVSSAGRHRKLPMTNYNSMKIMQA